MPKGVPNRRYSAEFKVKVIETMRAEGPEGFSVERRGHSASAKSAGDSRTEARNPFEDAAVRCSPVKAHIL